MPNRTELAIRAIRLNNDAADEDGVWTVVGLCTIGALLSIIFAAYFQVLDQLPMLMSQIPVG
ncbi:MAG TPA: hypothetical protein VMR17_12290 [Xanthobacteraceae bacterium]|jgi:hypothetical protein|nr:hypothetical protein [Xanthobacteraceae bacterium]